MSFNRVFYKNLCAEAIKCFRFNIHRLRESGIIISQISDLCGSFSLFIRLNRKQCVTGILNISFRIPVRWESVALKLRKVSVCQKIFSEDFHRQEDRNGCQKQDSHSEKQRQAFHPAHGFSPPLTIKHASCRLKGVRNMQDRLKADFHHIEADFSIHFLMKHQIQG